MLLAMLEARDVGCAESDEKIISFVMTRRHLGWREKAALLTSFLVLVAEQQEPRDADFVPERDSQLSDAAIDAAMDADGELSATPPDILAQLARSPGSSGGPSQRSPGGLGVSPLGAAAAA